MKKLALTNLMLLVAVKSVSACSYAIDPNNPVRETVQKENYDYIFFFASFAFILPIIGLYFLRKRQGLWAMVTGIASLLLYIPMIIATAFIFWSCESNDAVSNVIKAEFTLMVLLFSFQLFSWISQRKKPIKLQ